jgi:tyrosine-protein phosphatase non-receptor type 14/21
LAEGEVVREFEKIPKKKLSNCNTNVAMVSDNVNRNRFVNKSIIICYSIIVTNAVIVIVIRFKDVVPYDENRVKIMNDKDNKFGYVNASHISATVGDQQRFYIAAQVTD